MKVKKKFIPNSELKDFLVLAEDDEVILYDLSTGYNATRGTVGKIHLPSLESHQWVTASNIGTLTSSKALVITSFVDSKLELRRKALLNSFSVSFVPKCSIWAYCDGFHVIIALNDELTEIAAYHTHLGKIKCLAFSTVNGIVNDLFNLINVNQNIKKQIKVAVDDLIISNASIDIHFDSGTFELSAKLVKQQLKTTSESIAECIKQVLQLSGLPKSLFNSFKLVGKVDGKYDAIEEQILAISRDAVIETFSDDPIAYLDHLYKNNVDFEFPFDSPLVICPGLGVLVSRNNQQLVQNISDFGKSLPYELEYKLETGDTNLVSIVLYQGQFAKTARAIGKLNVERSFFIIGEGQKRSNIIHVKLKCIEDGRIYISANFENDSREFSTCIDELAPISPIESVYLPKRVLTSIPFLKTSQLAPLIHTQQLANDLVTIDKYLRGSFWKMFQQFNLCKQLETRLLLLIRLLNFISKRETAIDGDQEDELWNNWNGIWSAIESAISSSDWPTLVGYKTIVSYFLNGAQPSALTEMLNSFSQLTEACYGVLSGSISISTESILDELNLVYDCSLDLSTPLLDNARGELSLFAKFLECSVCWEYGLTSKFSYFFDIKGSSTLTKAAVELEETFTAKLPAILEKGVNFKRDFDIPSNQEFLYLDDWIQKKMLSLDAVEDQALRKYRKAVIDECLVRISLLDHFKDYCKCYLMHEI